MGMRDELRCKYLWLEMNAIADLGAKGLAEMLQDNSTLEWLDLDMNLITDVGAKWLAKALRNRPTRLHTLWLGGNPIEDEALKSELEGLVDTLKINRAQTQAADKAEEEA